MSYRHLMRWWRSRPKPEETKPEPTVMDLGDDPLNHDGDGVIRPGDPGWALFEQVMNGGGAVLANRRDDGTWDVKGVD